MLKGIRIGAFAAIANPGIFKKTLTEFGADLAFFKGFKDHYKFKYDEIQSLLEMKDRYGAEYLLTTEKDWVRLAPLAPECLELGYLGIRFGLLTGEDDLMEMIRNGNIRKQNFVGNHI